MAGEGQAPSTSAPAGTPSGGKAAPAATVTVIPDDSQMRSFKDLDAAYSEDMETFGKTKEPKPKKGEDLDEDELEDDDEFDDDDDDEEGEPEGDEESEEEESEDDEEGSLREEVLKNFDEEGRATFKINGKDRKYTWDQIKGIVTSGANNIEYRQRAEAEASQRHKQIQKMDSNLRRINEAVTPAWNSIKEKKFENAFLELASAGGASRLDVKRELRQQMIPAIAEWLAISPEWMQQRLRDPRLREYHETLEAKEENQFLREEAERAKARTPKEKPELPGLKEMRAIQSQFGIPDGKIKEAVKLLREAGELTGQEGQFPVKAVVQKVSLINAVERGLDAVMAVKPSLAENQNFLDSVISAVRKNPQIGNAELARLVRKRAKKAVSKEADGLQREISRKSLRGSGKSKLQAPKTKAQPQKDGRPVMSFRDLGGNDLF